MNIALTGPTGNVGAATITAAHERKLSIRALARNPMRLQVPAAETVLFDFADRGTYARALHGVDTLILISPTTQQQADTDGAVVAAARDAGVGHVIKLSGAGADEGATRFAAQHRAVERQISASGMAWTVVRPTFFMENLLGLATPIATGMYPAATANAPMGQVAVADIAAVLLAIAADPASHRSATYTPTGPAAYTGIEIATALSEAAGHHIRYVDIPEDALRQNLLSAGLDGWTADGLVEAYRVVRAGRAAPVTEDVRRLAGRNPIDFATWARAHRSAFRMNPNPNA
jgi:uncharacterized protein YbjT (DUF2867 family)